ncbi:hypothetical protein EMA8858_00879 [Emticicia aquatica]|uniref:Uncharacterized protein n=1 Tax=Emticicia aquatica TaxID=1681835 RepID=A0ABM9AM04_9BACT|nr:hypothetical protein EMA8858_00879 [Emticicia aquatica]
MFTFLEIKTSIGHLFMMFPLQFLLVGVLIMLGLYELYYTLGFERTFGQRKYIK